MSNVGEGLFREIIALPEHGDDRWFGVVRFPSRFFIHPADTDECCMGAKGVTSLATVVSHVSSSHLAGDFVFKRKSMNERSF
jgi:hypothetical protein